MKPYKSISIVDSEKNQAYISQMITSNFQKIYDHDIKLDKYVVG